VKVCKTRIFITVWYVFEEKKKGRLSLQLVGMDWRFHQRICGRCLEYGICYIVAPTVHKNRIVSSFRSVLLLTACNEKSDGTRLPVTVIGYVAHRVS
jgi:hypothetical protein